MCVVQWVQKVSVCCVLFCRVVSVAPFLPRDPSVQRIPFIPPGGDRTIFALWELLPPGDKECKIKHVETLRAVTYLRGDYLSSLLLIIGPTFLCITALRYVSTMVSLFFRRFFLPVML